MAGGWGGEDDGAGVDGGLGSPFRVEDIEPAEAPGTGFIEHFEANFAAVGEVDGVVLARGGVEEGLVRGSIPEEVEAGFPLGQVDGVEEEAHALEMSLGLGAEAEAGIGAVEAGGGKTADDTAPEAFFAVTVSSIGAGGSSIDLDDVHGAGVGGETAADGLEIIPVDLAFLVVVLGDVDEGVEFGVVEGAEVHGVVEVPGVPHFGGVDFAFEFGGAFLDEAGPMGAPFGGFVGFVIHAVEDVGVGEGFGEEFVNEGFLVFEEAAVVFEGRDGAEEGGLALAGVFFVGGFELGVGLGEGSVVFGVEGVELPGFAGEVEAVPDFDLEDNATFGGEAEEFGEAAPVFGVPAIEVVLAGFGVGEEGPDVARVA